MSETWITYRMADGSLIYGDFMWVENDEFFEELDEPIEVIKETWVLQKSETVIFEPSWWDEKLYDDEMYETTKTMKSTRSKDADDLY